MPTLQASAQPNAPARGGLSPVAMALVLALPAAVGNGFGRFAYALILPAMRHDLGWNYGQAGALGTANLVGYLLGALVSARLINRFGLLRVMLWATFVAFASLGATALVRGDDALLFWRLVCGIASGPAFVASTGLGARLGRDNTFLMGLTIAGSALGTLVAGLFLPLFLVGHDERWPLAWAVLAGLGALCWLVVTLATREWEVEPQTVATRESKAPIAWFLWPGMVAYFLFGLGYIAYLTFIVAFARSQGLSGLGQAGFFGVLGLSLCVSPWVWGRVAGGDADVPSGRPMAIIMGAGALGALVALWPAHWALLLSAITFGTTVFSVFTSFIVFVRRVTPPAQWTSVIALSTVIFAVGQALGPLGAGHLADWIGPQAALIWTGTMLVLAAGAALGQKPRGEKRADSEM